MKIEHIIDCDTIPYARGEWKVEIHLKNGQLKWDPKKISLFLSPEQRRGESISGCLIHARIWKQTPLNANVLDYLLANPDIIPEDWKDKEVLFSGTIYRNYNGDLYVRKLIWFGDSWGHCFMPRMSIRSERQPSAVLAR